MQSIGSSRGFFGCIHSSLITAALVVGTMVLAGNVSAQDQPSPSKPASMPEPPTMAAHAGASTSLRELVQEAEQKNPQIAASFHAWQASRNVPKQVSAFPETQVSVQQFSVGSPRPFAGYSNSDFAYIGFGASQDIPYPGKRQLRAHVAEHEADSMEAQTDSVRRTVVGNLKMVYFRLAYIQQTLGVLQKSDELLNQVQEAAEARYRVGQGNQQDVLKAQLQHTKILQEIAHHHQEEGLLEAQIKQLLGRPRIPRTSLPRLSLRDLFHSARPNSCRRPVNRIQTCAQSRPPSSNRKRRSNSRTRISVQISMFNTTTSTPTETRAITTWRPLASACPIADARRPS